LWRKDLLSLPAESKLLGTDDDSYFENKNLRQQIKHRATNFGEIAMELVFGIAGFRSQYERKHSETSNDEKFVKTYKTEVDYENASDVSAPDNAMSTTMIQNAWTWHNRALTIFVCRDAVLKSVAIHGSDSVFNSINKMHIVVFKARSDENIQWPFCFLLESVLNGDLQANRASGRVLQCVNKDKGLIALFVANRCRETSC